MIKSAVVRFVDFVEIAASGKVVQSVFSLEAIKPAAQFSTY